jgi:hypothetical protein
VPATVRMVNFKAIDDHRVPLPVRPLRDKRGHRLNMTPKQLRERMRRSKKGAKSEEFEVLYRPVEEWDAEELARGRPRDRDGQFKGLAPKWINRELHEEAMTRFRQVIRDGMNANTNLALQTISGLMTNEETDEDGKPKVSANVKLDAAKFLIDHTLGKPKQRVETDISVRLQGMLASAIITPGMLPAQPDAKALASPRDAAVDVWSREEDE